MKAMVFAAGRGTRLQPLTDARPKALVEVAGRTLLEQVLARLIAAGVTEVIVNLHYLGEQIPPFLAKHDNFGLRRVVF
jgi:MurNAc alpha-1-phosphate uridylyltransferase